MVHRASHGAREHPTIHARYAPRGVPLVRVLMRGGARGPGPFALCLSAYAYGYAWCVGLTCDNDESEVSITLYICWAELTAEHTT